MQAGIDGTSRFCVSTISAPANERENAATSHLKKITVRGHFARMENRCVRATLEQPCRLCGCLDIQRERERDKYRMGKRKEREGEGLFVGDENSSRSDVTGPLYIHALLIFTLLKDLSATRSAVIPAAPEYRGSIKRWRRNCVPKRIYRVTWKFLALVFRRYLSGWLELDLRWKFERQMMQKTL